MSSTTATKEVADGAEDRSRRERKRQLHHLNSRAWSGEPNLFKTSSSLDSSLKKNTAFIKKVRTALTAEKQAELLKDVQSLSLEKYLSEVVSGVAEGLGTCKTQAAVLAGVEIVSALHQRFSTRFTPYLTQRIYQALLPPSKSYLKGLSPEQREKEENTRISRQRVLIRVATEFWLAGILRKAEDGRELGEEYVDHGKAEGAPLPLTVMRGLLKDDKELVNLPLAVGFVKNFGFDVLGARTRTVRKTAEGEAAAEAANGAEGDHTEDTPLADGTVRDETRELLTGYWESVKYALVRHQKQINATARRNAEHLISSGQTFEDRQTAFNKLLRAQEKFVSSAQTLADALGVEMPHLPTPEEDRPESVVRALGSVAEGGRREGETVGSLWEDEDSRRFYEEVVDLSTRVPGIFLEAGKKSAEEEAAKEGEKKDKVEGTGAVGEEGGEMDLDEDEDEKEEEGDGADAAPTKTIGAQVDALLLRLPELTNRDLIDEFAVDFCFVNSKASRNRLIKTLYEIPRSRQDLLPYYARLIATLAPWMPDIRDKVVEKLDKEFRRLQRMREKDLAESRAKNIKYLSELTKFKICPPHVVFHCMKITLEDFNRSNIEILCHLLENCGRFLFRYGETSGRMGQMLEILNRKKSSAHLGGQERVMVENAFYQVNPPERAAIQQKDRSPVELYVRKLVYLDLSKKNVAKILKQLRKVNWQDPKMVGLLTKIFTKPWKIKFANLHYLAILVGGLSKYHPEFAVAVVDDVLEQIRLGLEQNIFKHNQRRIAAVKYLGELYNYKMVETSVIFDTLYLIVTLGHENGRPMPGRLTPLDPPDDFFRVRLVCALLESCGMCFDRGNSKKKLDMFLAFFQFYIHTKATLPMDVEFGVQDAFQLIRPDFKVHTSLEEAAKELDEIVARQMPQRAAEAKPEEVDVESDEGESEDEDEEGIDVEEELEAEEDKEAEVESDDDEDSEDEEESDEEEEVDVVVRRQREVDPEEEAEFEREFAKMMSESLETRKFERKQVFDVPLPVKRHVPQHAATAEPASTPAAPNGLAFTFLTKRGNKQQLRPLAVPEDSALAIATKNKQEAERAEQQKIKSLVLNYERTQEDEEKQALAASAARNGMTLRFGDVRGGKMLRKGLELPTEWT
ncbi:ARM repeat-containing protein [Saitoella complicata NRRL Y-17804]|uniref:ARM repeat-containing protein n=1 Tax=Saitoella complicata (strain BCRC 22490 / CBS 7301 / JCM 7358 / NBRC 10748 / NRRL Y-17804) TaxID=698492 RepID=UPI000866CF1D|nr:ARM repeat-containing protein [Saitoella complicata NRRL Y-17804]ODQ55597.1 ARM repeat-containing protein [Saitoella complicata NRRL Y-17804]